MSDDHPEAVTLEQIAERALTFQTYIFRRAWGTYYAIWAAAFVVFAFGGLLPLQNLVPHSLSWAPFAILYGVVGFGSGIATMLIFKNAQRTIYLRKAMGAYEAMQGRRFFLMWIWWLAFYIAIFLLYQFLPKEALSILYAMLFSVEIFIYYGLKFSFPNRTPFEGKLALASYGLCVALSFITSLFTPNFLILGILWGVTTAVWLFCAFYALWRASEELVALVY